MEIKKIISQFRRDFTAIYKCEHCGHEEEDSGYDDTYFHEKVVPHRKCPDCGKIADSNYRALTTKYPGNMTV